MVFGEDIGLGEGGVTFQGFKKDPITAEGRKTQQIIRQVSGSGSLFAVPENKVLFITTASIAQQHSTTGSSTNCRIVVDGQSAILKTDVGLGSGDVNTTKQCFLSMSYPMPIECKVSCSVALGIGSTSECTITGWLIDKQL